jgi:putative ABC transport system substrate-binding protein
MMHRRVFMRALLGSLVVPRRASQAADAKPARIGILSAGTGVITHLFTKFRERLAEHGYVEGQNVVIEYRFAKDKIAQLPDLAAQLIQWRPNVIIAIGPFVVNVAKTATATIPIVAIDFESDPVAAGFVASLGRPERNITGTFLGQAEVTGKWFELLKELIRDLSRVTVVWDSSTPTYQLAAIKAAAMSMALEVQTVVVRGADDFKRAFGSMAKSHSQAVALLSSPLVSRSGDIVANLATMARLPTVSMFRENVTAGCLMAYGPSLAEAWGRLGFFTGKILRGAKPSQLPIERPAHFEFVINATTVKALGLTIPHSLLLRADQVIE